MLPPGRWDPTARIAPPKCLPSQHKRYTGAFSTGLGSNPTVEGARGSQERDRNLPWDSETAGRDTSSHQGAGCPVMFWLEILRQPGFPFSSGSSHN